jgi:hypothetical protein
VHEQDEVAGSYILNNRNMYYKMGQAEYVQTDSFVYNIDHEEKMIVMTKEPVAYNSSMFPLKEFVDEIIVQYDTAYLISLRTEEDSKVIEFSARGDSLPYKKFSIYYTPESYYPEKFEMVILEPFDTTDVPDSLVQQVKIRPMEQRISIQFSAYYHPVSLDVFTDRKYVIYDRRNKFYRPAEAYKAYKLLLSGIEGDVSDPTVEVTAPEE